MRVRCPAQCLTKSNYLVRDAPLPSLLSASRPTTVLQHRAGVKIMDAEARQCAFKSCLSSLFAV